MTEDQTMQTQELVHNKPSPTHLKVVGEKEHLDGKWFWKWLTNFHAKVKGCSSESVHIWPYVGKAKMCLRCGRFYGKIVNTQLKTVI